MQKPVIPNEVEGSRRDSFTVTSTGFFDSALLRSE